MKLRPLGGIDISAMGAYLAVVIGNVRIVVILVLFFGLLAAGMVYQIMRYTPPEEVKMGRRSKRVANYKRLKRQGKEDRSARIKDFTISVTGSKPKKPHILWPV